MSGTDDDIFDWSGKVGKHVQAIQSSELLRQFPSIQEGGSLGWDVQWASIKFNVQLHESLDCERLETAED